LGEASVEGEYYHGITIDSLGDFIFDLIKIGFKFVFFYFRLNALLYSLLYDSFSSFSIFNFQFSIILSPIFPHCCLYIKDSKIIMEIDKIKRVVSGRASGEEQREVMVWARESEERMRLLKDADMFYGGKVSGELEEEKRIEGMWLRMRLPREKRRWTMVWRRWVAVAACVAVVAGVVLWMQNANDGNGERVELPRLAHSKGVQLILPDGSTHQITTATTSTVKIPGFRVDENIVVQERQETVDTSVVEYTEIVVPRGGEYSLMLADGTSVILNSETRVRFPNSFTGAERKIFLSGEAYFNVARDEKRPFLVEFLGGTVRVLGTRFNVKAYMNQSTYATLVSGKVEVVSGRDSVVLKPGELCEIVAADRSLSVREADLMTVLAWKNGDFVFKNASLEQVMDELARWYDAEIVYDSSEFRGMKFHIYMDRAKTLEEALDVISKMGEITYKIEGKKVIIDKR
jgi:fecR protein